MIDTKQRILDTAERLFGGQGYGETSLRQIIAEAGVNLAAIHYHYGSKEELLVHVVARKADPVNQERLARLDRMEAASDGKPLRLEQIIEAFLAPAVLRASANPDFAKLMGRLHAEGLAPTLLHKHFQGVANRFMAAVGAALPELSPVELNWRCHFLVGVMAHTLCSHPDGVSAFEGEEGNKVLRRMVAFICGGLRAPATEIMKSEAE
jgi:AcrR family transcriptional regulator